MKILTTQKITEIDILTTHLHDFIHNLQNDSLEKVIEKRNCIYKLNEVRNICGLPGIVSLPMTTSKPPMPPVKPPKQEEHIHDFMILHTNEVNATICCRACGEVRHIETSLPMERPSNKIIKISIEDFEDICDGAASFRELKELLIKRMEEQ